MAGGVSFQQLKAGFFDVKKITDDAARAHAKVQAAFGAKTRRRMQTSLRYRKKASEPGKPPSAHRGRGGKSPLRELIFFSRDLTNNSVVIGPLPFGQRGASALERGGVATFKARDGKIRTGVFEARPFARPAGDAEAKAQNFSELLRANVR